MKWLPSHKHFNIPGDEWQANSGVIDRNWRFSGARQNRPYAIYFFYHGSGLTKPRLWVTILTKHRLLQHIFKGIV